MATKPGIVSGTTHVPSLQRLTQHYYSNSSALDGCRRKGTHLKFERTIDKNFRGSHPLLKNENETEEQ